MPSIDVACHHGELTARFGGGVSRKDEVSLTVQDDELAAFGISLRLATEPRELDEAFRLVYHSYLRAGLTDELPQKLRVTTHQLQETSEVFVAVKDGHVISTVSLIGDGALGLPMEDVYPDQVQELRDAGLCVAEVSCLADRRESVGRAKFVLMKLMILLAQNAQAQGVDKLLIAVHPRHVSFYRRLMGFEQVGNTREYGLVLGRPAVALSIDLRWPTPENGEAFQQFFAHRYPSEQITRKKPRSLAFLRHYRPLALGQPQLAH